MENGVSHELTGLARMGSSDGGARRRNTPKPAMSRVSAGWAGLGAAAQANTFGAVGRCSTRMSTGQTSGMPPLYRYPR